MCIWPVSYTHLLSREEVLYAGDSNVDIETARNAGLDSCGVLWGFRSRQELEAAGAVHLAHSPAALAALLGLSPAEG